MEQRGSAILFRNPQSDLLSKASTLSSPPQTLYYNKGEELYLTLKHEYEVPSFPIHHDVRNKVPQDDYLKKIKGVLSQIVDLCPSLLEGLNYSFDPTDTLKVVFFSIYRLEEQNYLYVLKIDLSPRHGTMRIVVPGTNDVSPQWRSNKLFIDSELIPVADITKTLEGYLISPKQSISETWIGETGRGYFVQGIWLDRDLTKFFSKLFLPKGKKMYPFYPFNCRFRAVCATVIHLSAEGRKQDLADLHQARKFIEQQMANIELALHKSEFSEDLETFISLRAMVGSSRITDHMDTITVRAYLNTEDEKEYELNILSQ